MVHNLFEYLMPSDNCPMCGAPKGACNDYLNEVRYVNPDPSARILVESDIYVEQDREGKKIEVLKWRRGEFISREEADHVGVRQVPWIVRLDRERVDLEVSLGVKKKEVVMQGSSENKAFKASEDKVEKSAEDKNASNQSGGSFDEEDSFLVDEEGAE